MKIRDIKKERLANEIDERIFSFPKNTRKIIFKGVLCYFKALKTFGPSSPVTKEALVAIKDVLKISSFEKDLLFYILKNLDSMDYSAAKRVVDKLSELNNKSLNDYELELDNLVTACEKKNDERVLQPEGIDSILNNKDYEAMVVGLDETTDDVKSFLAFEDEFWDFIETYQKVTPESAELAQHTSGVYPLVDENNVLTNFYTIVPEVIDLDTALIAIKTYMKAHDYYVSLGTKLDQVVVTPSTDTILNYKSQMQDKADKIFK